MHPPRRDLVEIDSAFVVSMDELARAGERIELHRIGLVGDLLDDDAGVVSLNFVKRDLIPRYLCDPVVGTRDGVGGILASSARSAVALADQGARGRAAGGPWTEVILGGSDLAGIFL